MNRTGAVNLYDLESTRAVGTANTAKIPGSARLVFSPAGNRALVWGAAGSDMLLIDLENGKRVASIDQRGKGTLDVRFSRDGALLLTSFDGGGSTLYRAADGGTVAKLALGQSSASLNKAEFLSSGKEVIGYVSMAVELTTRVLAMVLPFLGVAAGGPVHLDVELTRDTLEAITADLIARCRQVCHDTLDDAGMGPRQIDRVILVGGATRMPSVTELVRDLSGSSPVRPVNPDEAVALGAAIYAAMVQGHVKGLNLTEVTPMALGIEVSGGLTRSLIPKNTPVPATVTQVFTTSTDDQTSVRVRILQGDHAMRPPTRCSERVVLDNIPRGRRGSARIAVTYRTRPQRSA
ncbi:MAG: Hsp70 family protein, partial [Gammaproteobacteria bacterium]|nr:Hsp70 family protein [Gammaproteobacteria bacterium]